MSIINGLAPPTNAAECQEDFALLVENMQKCVVQTGETLGWDSANTVELSMQIKALQDDFVNKTNLGEK